MDAASYFANDRRTNFERMLAGDPYIANETEHREAYLRALRLSHKYERQYLDDPGAAIATLRELCGFVGDAAEVRPPLRVDYGMHLYIGAGGVVTRDIPANSVAVGVPARVIRTLDVDANPYLDTATDSEPS